MKLKTSFFDQTVFRKDLLRFAPLWALYFIGGMMVMLTITGNTSRDADYWTADVAVQSIGVLSSVNFIYACLAAQLLFGDLFNSRLCNALHAMPLRRENWFLTHLLSGVCYSLVPNAVGIFLLMFRMGQYWYVGPVWLLGMTLHYLFFFGLAVFSMFCTGKRFAAVAVYLLLNFGSLVALWFCDTIYMPMLYGVEMDMAFFEVLCPVWILGNTGSRVWMEPAEVYNGLQDEFARLGEGWGYLAILAGVGLALLAVSLLMYRRRKLESAGDFIAARPLAPVFSVVFTLCTGAVFAMVGQLTGGDYGPYLILGMLVGWFVAQMLLQRTIKVFSLKQFGKAGLLIAVMFVSVLLVQTDAFNIIGWVPEQEAVKSVTLANYKASPYIYDVDEGYSGNRVSLKLTEQEDIEKILLAHEDILARKDTKVQKGHRVVLTYEMKDGRTVQRNYWTHNDGVNGQIIGKILGAPEVVFGYTNWTEYVKNVHVIYFDKGQVSKDMIPQVLAALKKDCENGQITLSGNMDAVQWVHIEGKGNISRRLAVLSGAENTLALQKSPKMVLGYGDWDAFVAGVEYALVGELDLETYASKESREAFFLALRADCEKGEIWLDGSVGDYCTKVEYGVQEKGGEYVYRYLFVGKNAENTIAWLKQHLPQVIA